MQTLLVAFVVLLAFRYLVRRKLFQGREASFEVAVKDEVAAWFIVIAALAGIFVLVLVFTLLFGPIPQVHEWGRR